MNEQNEVEERIEIPKYIEQLFNYFCDRKCTVNLSCIGMEIDFMDQSLKEILFMKLTGQNTNTVDINTLTVILPNLNSYIDEKGVDVWWSPK